MLYALIGYPIIFEEVFRSLTESLVFGYLNLVLDVLRHYGIPFTTLN